jgi:ribosomal-protein-alanine N-acetyltransferase
MDFSFHEVSLTAPRLVLRTLRPEDATQTYANWLNDSEVNKFLETKSGTVESVRTYIEAKQKQHDTLFFGMFVNGAMIGTIKLEPIKRAEGSATVALMIGERSAWGKGYGPESLRTLIQYAFNELGLRRIELDVMTDHAGAIRAYEKVGFTKFTQGAPHKPGHMAMLVTPETFGAQEVTHSPV